MLSCFASARTAGRAALIGYLPAGFPNPSFSAELMCAMVAGGVDIVEVGLPYSDPLMDGPVIQEAAATALAAGTTTVDVFSCVSAVAATGAVPVVMSYWNPIERYGVERFASELATAGGCGVITPDLTPEEAGAWTSATDAHGIARTYLVAPSSSAERIRIVTSACTGFVYAASTMGVTGARTAVSSAAPELVARVRPETSLPIAVGIGVSTGEQASTVAGYADGVIVGSAFVRLVLDSGSNAAALRAVEEFARELATGVRSASR